VPWVVSAVKLGASEFMRNDIFIPRWFLAFGESPAH